LYQIWQSEAFGQESKHKCLFRCCRNSTSVESDIDEISGYDGRVGEVGNDDKRNNEEGNEHITVYTIDIDDIKSEDKGRGGEDGCLVSGEKQIRSGGMSQPFKSH
jgi:hypothetical protein